MHKRNDTVQNFAARQCCLLGHPVSWTNCFDQCWTASHNWVIFFLTENSFFNAMFWRFIHEKSYWDNLKIDEKFREIARASEKEECSFRNYLTPLCPGIAASFPSRIIIIFSADVEKYYVIFFWKRTNINTICSWARAIFLMLYNWILLSKSQMSFK